MNQNILDQKLKITVDSFLDKYKSGAMSHDLLAKESCQVFADHLKGIDKATISTAINHYMNIDKRALFRFSSTIFQTLRRNKILPIIVSGAPQIVIEHYSGFGIHEIYGFSVEENNGFFTGKVSSNYGYDKRNIVNKIISEMKCPPVIAFGDSMSDYEMLYSAQKSVIVCKSISDVPFKSDAIIHNHSSRVYVQNIINKTIVESTKHKLSSFG